MRNGVSINKKAGGVQCLKQILSLLSLIFLLLIFNSFLFAQEESLTITTYYPSPFGSYRELTAYQMKIGQNYSGSGIPFVNNGLIVEGNVGIGTTGPQYSLDVNGQIHTQSVSGIVFSNSTNQVAAAPFSNVWVATSTQTFTVPAGVTRIWVEVYGGGGGGGGYYGGGGAGGVAMGFLSVTPGQKITATVGAGGAGGVSTSAGRAGGTSSFSTISASGGIPGNGNKTGNGGTGGSGSGGIINQSGGGGGASAEGDNGGSNTRGGGGSGRGDTGDGNPGGDFGGGGGSGGGDGGRGGNGGVIIWY